MAIPSSELQAMTRRLFLALGAIAPWAGAGCGSKAMAAPTLKGRVWYRGAPLPGGMIVFVPDEERGHAGDLLKGELAADGAFDFSSPPLGWYRVAVAPLPSASVSTPSPASPYPGVPARYRNPNLSGLRAEIKPGENTVDFELDDA
jgi:hypothetical protein